MYLKEIDKANNEYKKNYRNNKNKNKNKIKIPNIIKILKNNKNTRYNKKIHIIKNKN